MTIKELKERIKDLPDDMKGTRSGVVFRPYVKPSFLINPQE